MEFGDYYSEDEQADFESSPLPPKLLDAEDFEGTFQDELVEMYDVLLSWSRVGGWPLFENMSYHDFVDFAWKNSSKRTTSG
jgi:hypothetical protein